MCLFFCCAGTSTHTPPPPSTLPSLLPSSTPSPAFFIFLFDLTLMCMLWTGHGLDCSLALWGQRSRQNRQRGRWGWMRIPVERWGRAPGLFLMEMDKCNLAHSESLHRNTRWGRVLKGSLGTLPFLRTGFSYISTGPGVPLVKAEVIGYGPADHPGVQVSSISIRQRI